MEIVVGSVFLIVGSAFAFGALLLIRRTIRRLNNWKTTSGTVVDYSGRDSDGKTSYRPKIEFMSPGGKKITFTSDTGSSRKSYGIGDAVRVLYNPEQWEEAALKSFTNLWLFPIVITFFGGTFAALGVNLLFYTRH